MSCHIHFAAFLFLSFLLTAVVQLPVLLFQRELIDKTHMHTLPPTKRMLGCRPCPHKEYQRQQVSHKSEAAPGAHAHLRKLPYGASSRAEFIAHCASPAASCSILQFRPRNKHAAS